MRRRTNQVLECLKETLKGSYTERVLEDDPWGDEGTFSGATMLGRSLSERMRDVQLERPPQRTAQSGTPLSRGSSVLLL